MKLEEILREEHEKLPDNVQEAFYDIANQQRGSPEKVMLKIQHTMGGGVLNPVVEHTGDLIHRMTKNTLDFGYEPMKEKVDRVLKYLSSPYGFKKEMEENIRNNARYKEIDPEQFKDKLEELLEKYAEEHSNLPVYNEAQYLANQAAINIGKEKFNSAIKNLENLKSHLSSKEEWIDFSSQYQIDNNGNLVEYSP